MTHLPSVEEMFSACFEVLFNLILTRKKYLQQILNVLQLSLSGFRGENSILKRFFYLGSYMDHYSVFTIRYSPKVDGETIY